ncbi:MAG: hypothetical protein AAF609_05310 [Cyanobacteria bacterium P01_C01_bin.120]
MPFNDDSNPIEQADNLIFSNVARATAARRKQERDREVAARSSPLTGRAAQYDVVTGDWLVQIAGGGTLRSQLNSNGAPVGRVPIQRNADAQLSTISALPTEANFSDLIEQIDLLSRALVSLMGTNIGNGDPNAETTPGVLDVPFRYPNDRYIDLDTGLHYYWDATAEEWKLIPIREEQDGFIPEAEDGAITIIPGSGVDLRILDLTTIGTGTGTLSVTPGNTLTAGNSLTLTLSGTDGSSFGWTLGLMRV